MAAVVDGILDTTKLGLGIFPEDKTFDPIITMHINTVFGTIAQLGFGPETPFRITGPDEVWDYFLQGRDELAAVRSYMINKVRLMWDPPTLSFVLTALQSQITEFEWRLNVAGETP